MWSGQKFNSQNEQIFDLSVCNYQAAPHLCVTFEQGNTSPRVPGYSLIIDSNYNQVQALAPSVQYDGQTIPEDRHEFNMLGANGASALLTSFVATQHSAKLTSCPGSPTVKWIFNGAFTETSTDGLNTTLFQWNALDHVNVTDTYVCPGEYRVNSGASVASPFDFL